MASDRKIKNPRSSRKGGNVQSNKLRREARRKRERARTSPTSGSPSAVRRRRRFAFRRDLHREELILHYYRMSVQERLRKLVSFEGSNDFDAYCCRLAHQQHIVEDYTAAVRKALKEATDKAKDPMDLINSLIHYVGNTKRPGSLLVAAPEGVGERRAIIINREVLFAAHKAQRSALPIEELLADFTKHEH